MCNFSYRSLLLTKYSEQRAKLLFMLFICMHLTFYKYECVMIKKMWVFIIDFQHDYFDFLKFIFLQDVIADWIISRIYLLELIEKVYLIFFSL